MTGPGSGWIPTSGSVGAPDGEWGRSVGKGGRRGGRTQGAGPVAVEMAIPEPTVTHAGVHSEVGVLRRVLVHRPGLELSRLTPSNKDEFLFDEIPWTERAQEEHDAFVEVLGSCGVEVLELRDLLAEVLAIETVRARLIESTMDRGHLERAVARPLAERLHALAPRELADVLIGGVTITETPSGADCLLARIDGGRQFAIPPLPNHVFVRDSSAWIGDRPYLGEMALPARRREAAHLLAVYRHHPRFQDGREPFTDPASLEGGDVLVLAPGRVLVGVGARTSPAAVERMALALTARDATAQVLVAVLPTRRATIHLDTVVTMVDRDAFTIYPEVAEGMRIFRLRRAGEGLRIDARSDLGSALADMLGLRSVRLIPTGGDPHARDREQWNDANNVLALSPGVVIGYDRNVATNERLHAAGVEVLTFPGAELGRGRGGARCLSCPLERESPEEGARP